MERRASIFFKNFQYNRHSLVPSVHYRTLDGWARRKNFQNKGSQLAGKCYFDKDPCIYSTNNSFDYTFFKLLYKSNVNFDNVMTQFYLAFSNPKFGGLTPPHSPVATPLMSTTINFSLASPLLNTKDGAIYKISNNIVKSINFPTDIV